LTLKIRDRLEDQTAIQLRGPFAHLAMDVVMVVRRAASHEAKDLVVANERLRPTFLDEALQVAINRRPGRAWMRQLFVELIHGQGFLSVFQSLDQDLSSSGGFQPCGIQRGGRVGTAHVAFAGTPSASPQAYQDHAHKAPWI
jgi:hypothetical protein